MGGVHTCSVRVSVTVGTAAALVGLAFGTTSNGVLTITVPVPTLGNVVLSGIPCPTLTPITITIPANTALGLPAVTIVIEASEV
ncbi:hypothetical protein [Priestia megaterium]|uniref:hypothetical protein n=1 Tax=Priestia megaterium TaxID=1404 RepID=UPI0035A95A75